MRGRRRKGKEERDEGVFRTRLTRERSLGRRYEGVKEVRLERGRQRGKRRRVNSIIVGFINLGCRPSLNPKISRGRAQYCSAPCNQNADYRPPRIPTVSLFSVNLSSEHAARSTSKAYSAGTPTLARSGIRRGICSPNAAINAETAVNAARP